MATSANDVAQQIQSAVSPTQSAMDVDGPTADDFNAAPEQQPQQPPLDNTKAILSCNSAPANPYQPAIDPERGVTHFADDASAAGASAGARIMSHLKGFLYGLAGGGIPGAVTGAVAPKIVQNSYNRRQEEANAGINFESARAQMALAQAFHDHLVNDELSDENKQKASDRAIAFIDKIRTIDPNIPAPTIIEANDAAAEATSRQLAAQNGGPIPVTYSIPIPSPDGQPSYVATINLSAAAQAKTPPAYLKDYADKYGLDANVLQQQWTNGNLDARTKLASQALSALHPQLDSSNPLGQILTLQGVKRQFVLAHTGKLGADDLAAGQKWFDDQISMLQAQYGDLKTAMAEQSKIAAQQQAEAAGAKAEATGEKQKNLAEANKANQETMSAASLSQPDALGFTPNVANVGGVKNYESIQKSFKKNADDLAQTEQTFQQFGSILSDINAGKDMTGAQSVVGLLSAIGISAEPLKGKGFRVNNNVIEEHTEARGLSDTLYQKLLRVKNGDVITSQQLKDYATIAQQAREQKYVALVNEAHNAGLNADFLLPAGNGQHIDPSTARIFLTLTGGDKDNARAAAAKKGWVF